MLVEAYGTRTGKKLPNRVPAKAVGDPVVGPHLSLTPQSKAAGKKAARFFVPMIFRTTGA